MKCLLGLGAVLVVFGGLAAPATAVHAEEGVPQLAARFVQWALSIPNPSRWPDGGTAVVNPVVDPTGVFCSVGQQGAVWFLAGTFGGTQDLPGGTLTRSCTVPEGVTLFFPVINGFAFNTPGCGQDVDLRTVKQLKRFYYDYVRGFINDTTNVSATLNGRRLDVQRAESVPFLVANSQDNDWGPNACGDGLPLAPGIYSPGITDGYWVELAPLKASATPYTLHFHAESGSTVQDITYNLTVMKVNLK